MSEHSTTDALEVLAELVPVAVCLVEVDTADRSDARLRFSNQSARTRFGDRLAAGATIDGLSSVGILNDEAVEKIRGARPDDAAERVRLAPAGDAIGDVMVVRRLDPEIVALVCDSSGDDWQRREFHAVVDSALEAILTKTLDGTVLSWNAAASRLYGYSAQEAIGMPITTLLPPDRQDEVAGIVARLRTGERISEFETKRVRKDGVVIDVSLTITPIRGPGDVVIGAATIARDLTERQLVERRRRLAAIVDATFYPVFSVDLGGTILSWNAAAERLFGYSAADLVGTPVDRLLPSIDLATTPIAGPPTPEGQEVAPISITARTKAGVELTIEVSISTIRDDDGAPSASAVVLRDITLQRQLEDRLRQNQKMEAIGRLASGVAHDFNNVLAVIRTASGLLHRELQDAQALELVGEIERAAVHATALTEQLLAFGRRQVLHPQPTDLEAQLAPLLGMVRSLLASDIALDVDLEPGLPRIQFDRTQLGQVVINLCANAGDAMAGGGRLTVRTRLDRRSLAPAPEGSAGAVPTVVLEVHDTGVGMDSDTRDHIFDPFFTTKETGTGLGLATVHGIVAQSGGHIEVDSRPGVGTTFRVHFPLATGAVELPADEVVRSDEPGGGETVLIVDDSSALRLMLSKVAEAAGYRVLTAGSGREALEVASDHDGPIDLLLTDVVMPGMGAPELYEALSATRPGLRVVFASGYAADDVVRHGIEAGRFDYLQKPMTNEALLAKLREVLDRPDRPR